MEHLEKFKFLQMKDMEPEDTYGDSLLVNHRLGEYFASKYLESKNHTTEYMGGIVLALFSFLLGGAVSGIILYLAEKGTTVWMK